MSLQQSWEAPLLSLAHEALHDWVTATAVHHRPVLNDPTLLNQAYAHCSAITAENSRSFYMASALYPADKRRAARALYAFCRVADDLIDEAADEQKGLKQLEEWRKVVFTHHPPADDLVAVAWADTRTRYNLPRRYAEQLFEGITRDLTKKRYNSFDELATYAYGVASTVGLLSMHITGYTSEAAIPYAIKLGVALQLTNILRDVAEDWRRGRLYLPLDELAQFGLTEQDIAAGVVTPAWQAFMQFQISRTRRLYEEARPGIQLLSPDGRFAIAAASALYEGILTDIEQHQYDVFSRRAYVSTWGKIKKLPVIWWSSRG